MRQIVTTTMYYPYRDSTRWEIFQWVVLAGAVLFIAYFIYPKSILCSQHSTGCTKTWYMSEWICYDIKTGDTVDYNSHQFEDSKQSIEGALSHVDRIR